MDSSSVIAIIAVVAGAAASVFSPLLRGRQEQRHRRDDARRELLVNLCIDAVVYAESIKTALDELADPYGNSTGVRVPTVHTDLITARMRLIAPVELQEAWHELVRSYEVLAWNLNENGPTGPDGMWHLPATDPDPVRVSAAITVIVSAARSAAGMAA